MHSSFAGYEYDIFISYRHNDNRGGWVTEFVKALQEELAATIKEPVSVYFDTNPHDGLQQHHEVDDSLREKLKSLILIPIISQTYCDPKAFAWAHELIPFIQQATEDKLGLKTKVSGGNIASRVLPIKIHDIDGRDKHLFEEATGGVMRSLDFIYKESGVNRPLRPADERNQNQEHTDYRNQVNKVANAIKDIIAGLTDNKETILPESGSKLTNDATVKPQKPYRKKAKFVFPQLSKVALLTIALLFFAVALASLAILHFSETAEEKPTFRSIIPPPENMDFSSRLGPSIAMSPDGRTLAFVARDSAGKELLWVRPLDALNGQALKGTEGAAHPFWSPDNRHIGFFADGKLKKIEASGGATQTICDASYGRGGTWNENGTIVFCPSTTTPLHLVSDSGGSPVAITKLDTGGTVGSHRWPQFLPDGKHIIYTARSASGYIEDAVYITSLDTTFIPKKLFNSNSSVFFANGHLLFAQGQALMAQPFDTKSLETTGGVFPIADRVYVDIPTAKTSLSVSENGVLVYQKEGPSIGTLPYWYDRNGKADGNINPESVYFDVRISPDGKRVAVSRGDNRNTDIWLYEISRASWTRFTFDPVADRNPIWSPDGSTIVFVSSRNNSIGLFQRSASGAGSEERLLHSKIPIYSSDWSRDGKFIAYDVNTRGGNSDIWILPMHGEQKPFPFLQSEFGELRPMFSPDGRWIAYQSNESGRDEIYIRPFPGPGGKWQVSTNSGTRPLWRNDGKELFYLSNNGIVSAEIRLGTYLLLR